MAKIDGRTLDHKALEHIRILAVRRVVEDGEAPSVVMESLGFLARPFILGCGSLSRRAGTPWLSGLPQGPNPNSRRSNGSKSSAGSWGRTRANMALTLACGAEGLYKP